MILIAVQSLNDVEIANSDGWDTYRSDRVVIQDSYIINTDGKYFVSSLALPFHVLTTTRLRLVQTQQYQRRHSEFGLHRIPWNERRLSRSIRQRDRYRGKPLYIQRLPYER